MIVCFFGDSLVKGVGDPLGLGWAGRVGLWLEKSGHTFYNLGVRKNSSAALLGRWENEARERRLPGEETGLVFSFGAVDTAMAQAGPLLSPPESLENARAILSPAQKAGPVLMVGPPIVLDPDHSARITELSQGLSALCQGLGLDYLDLSRELAGSDAYTKDLKAGDGIHPGAAGYELIFRLVRARPAWSGRFKDQ